MTTRGAAAPAPGRGARPRRVPLGGWLGGAGVATIVVVGLVGPAVLQTSPEAMDVVAAFSPPSHAHPFGTDEFGRDLLSRVVHGARISLGVGVSAVLLAASLGTLLGVLTGFYGGWIDALAMRVVDVMMGFPNLLLALGVIAVLGAGIRNTIIAVGFTFVPLFTRMIRAVVLRLAREEFVVATRSIGCGAPRIIARHLLPNLWPTVLVTATLVFGWAVLSVSSLSFIGLGVQPPSPEWGAMLSEARANMQIAWWSAAAPGAAIILLILSTNLLGDALREALDPRLRL